MIYIMQTCIFPPKGSGMHHNIHIYAHTHTIKQKIIVCSAALLTFHCILHVLGEEVPHDLRADLAHTQLLRKPGGIETDSNQTHFRIMTRSTGWPDGLAQPQSLTEDLTDVQKDMVGESHNLIMSHHFQTWLNRCEMKIHAQDLKMRKKKRKRKWHSKEERRGGSLFGK